MIIWSRFVDDVFHYRRLGSMTINAVTSSNRSSEQLLMLRHNEFTTRHNGTSPTIGSGMAKGCRDHCVRGYDVSATLGEPNTTPKLLDYERDHIVSYDIETEYVECSSYPFGSPILCISIVCTCGWKVVISRHEIWDSGVECIVRSSNEEIAILCITE